MNIASCIRLYETFNGGQKSAQLRHFHKFLKQKELHTGLMGGGPPGLSGLSGLSGMSSILDSNKGHLEFNDIQTVKESTMSEPAFIDRLNDNMKIDMELNALLACGQYACTYTTNMPAIVCKVIPFRPASSMFHYGMKEFQKEIGITKALGEANLGPTFMNASILKLQLDSDERDELNELFTQDVGDVWPMFCIVMQRVEVVNGKGIEYGSVNVAEIVDQSDELVADYMKGMIQKANELLECELDVGDVEWGFVAKPFILQNMRLFDVACNHLPHS